jgi:hypothetical protein
VSGCAWDRTPARAEKRPQTGPVRTADRIAPTAEARVSVQATLGNQAVQRALLSDLGLQAKLTVNVPGDPYEQEADRVADTVMRMSDDSAPGIAGGLPLLGRLQRRSAHCEGEHERTVVGHIQRRCAHCEQERALETTTRSGFPLQRACAACEQEHEEELHRKPAGDSSQPPEATQDVERRIGTLRDAGSTLSPDVRAVTEPRFGRDFGGVRVHTGGPAAEAARAVNARAFTVGHDIVFGPGEFSPQTPGGLRLLAHELTHVVQQGQAGHEIRRSPLARGAVSIGTRRHA